MDMGERVGFRILSFELTRLVAVALAASLFGACSLELQGLDASPFTPVPSDASFDNTPDSGPEAAPFDAAPAFDSSPSDGSTPTDAPLEAAPDSPPPPSCGDGRIDTGEQCDDKNTASDDGCSSACVVEHGFACTGQPSKCKSTCGDGIVASDERCDDGNTVNGDGCNSGCIIVRGWMCSGEPSRCTGEGCADGDRDGFLSPKTHPDIAGCLGAWDAPGILSTRLPTCNRQAGDRGSIPNGQGCSAADLCAINWHVCESAAEVLGKSSSGCDNATPQNSDAMFFATRQSGPGSNQCGAGANDLFGCGSAGNENLPTCAPLTRASGDLCSALPSSWHCGSDGYQEANNVTKSANEGGGVLCCRD